MGQGPHPVAARSSPVPPATAAAPQGAGGRTRWRQRPATWAAGLAVAALLGFLAIPPEAGGRVPYSTVLFDRDGALLGATVAADQQWRFPHVTTLPERYARAVVAFEDRRYFSHPGVDPIATLRAAYDNLRAGRIVSGGSTLTMQAVRLLRGNPPRRFTEKAIEIALAIRLSLHLSKQEVLALYATHAPFGGNVVGIEAASWRYFGRPPQQLSWAEAATLAVLPNAPGLIHPGRDRRNLIDKRNRLLDRLHRLGEMTDIDLRLALAEPIPEAPTAFPQLAAHLLHRPEWQGRRVVSTIDHNLQQRAIDLMQSRSKLLHAARVPNAAFLVVDNRERSVIAYVANADNDGDKGQAIDLIRRPRSSGSIFKPLLFALMLEHGEILPGSLVADVPTQISGYTPENFDKSYRGAVRADTALALSLNIPAVRLLRGHGVERFLLELRRMGLGTLGRSADDYGLTLVLGGAEATLWDLAGAYSNLAAIAQDLGKARRYRPIRIDRSAPADLADGDPAEYGPGAAYLTLTAMSEVNRPGLDAYWKQFSSSRKVAWKTGTSFGLRDAWAIAVTPEHTVAVWAGNAHGEGIAGLSGTQTAAPLLFDVLSLLPASSWFNPPQHDLKLISVCRDDGYLPRSDCDTENSYAPKNSHFDQGSRWHERLWLDVRSGLRVTAACRIESKRRAVSWFRLPPGMEFYFRRYQPTYRRTPAWAPDCTPPGEPEEMIEILYPEPGSMLFIPTELDGSTQAVIAQAVHRDPDAELHWHLDQRYLGSTRTFHQKRIETGYGPHVLTLVDAAGQRTSRSFAVTSALR